MEKTRGYTEAVVFNLLIGGGLALLTKALGTWLLHPIAGTLLAYLALAASFIYFGWMGFRQIAVGFNGIQLILGTRTRKIYSEGWVWNWPKPIGDIQVEDMREQTLDLELTEVLTEDNVPVSVNLAVQFRISDIRRFLDVQDARGSLKQATDSVTRVVVQGIVSEHVAQEKKNIPENVKNGTIEGLEEISLHDYASSQWGLEIVKVRITHIRLPEELEAARTNVQVMKAEQSKEQQQAAAEVIEANHVAQMIKIYTDAGLDPALAVNIAQSERGKATRLIIDGTGNPLEKAGALAGGILNQPAPSSPAPKGGRRRGNQNKE